MRRRGRRVLLTAAALSVAILAGLWTAPRWLVPLIAERSPRCLYTVPVAERVVALTLDDGPDTAATATLLELLRSHDARATFFLISSRVQGRERLVEQVVRDGHELGNHLTHDEPSIELAPATFASKLREADSVLARYGLVRWLRPGSGWYDETMLDTLERAGYRCALASVYPLDAQLRAPRLAAAYISSNVTPGAVIVLHEGGARSGRTRETLGRVLPALRARGYRVVTLSELDAMRVAPGSSSP